MPSLTGLRYRYLASPSSNAGRSLADLNETASNPPERLYRSAVPTSEPLTFYIFRIPGRQELCLSLSRPGADVVTDIDVSAAFYLLRFDEEGPRHRMTLLRLDPGIDAMEEVAMIDDPPGTVEVFEHAYANIERKYWDARNSMGTHSQSSFTCPILSKQAALTFTTPWVGAASLVPSKLGNALKCYHVMPHIEGDQARQKVQISELRFNFSMPKVSADGVALSRRAALPHQLRNVSNLENWHNKRRSFLSSSADSTESSESRATSRNSSHPSSGSSDRGFRHPSFTVPVVDVSHGQLNDTNARSHTQRPMLRQPSDLGQVMEEDFDTKGEGLAAIDAFEAARSPVDMYISGDPISTSHTGMAEVLPNDPVEKQRIPGPRPQPKAGSKTRILGERVETRVVSSGTPVKTENNITVVAQQAEPSTEAAEAGILRDKSREQQPPRKPPNLDTDSVSRTATIKRKPVRSGTGNSSNSPATPISGKENTPLSSGSARTSATLHSRQEPHSIPRRPVSMYSHQEQSPGISTLPRPATYSEGEVLRVPELPPRPGETSDRPTLPPRPRSEPRQSHLDLSLGQEKLGGGFDGEQAKLGKLIVETEGQKMLDLIVAANLLAFRRAFVAADMMERRR